MATVSRAVGVCLAGLLMGACAHTSARTGGRGPPALGPRQQAVVTRSLNSELFVHPLREVLQWETLDWIAENDAYSVKLLERSRAEPALLRSAEVSAEMSSIACDLLRIYFRAYSEGEARVARVVVARSFDWLWEGMRELKADPRWPIKAPEHVEQVLASARRFRNDAALAVPAAAGTKLAMETALLAHSALSLVRLVQASGPALERLVRGMRGMRMEMGVLQFAETGGGIPYIRLVAPAGAIALTQEEVIALTEAGQISQTALGLYMMMRRPTGGAGPPREGAKAEERVSKKIGIRRNVGSRQEKIPSASGAKKYRIPDFPPSITAVERGSIVEVKNVKGTVYVTKQLEDLLSQAERIGGRIELFTNAPISRTLLAYEDEGLLLVHPIPP